MEPGVKVKAGESDKSIYAINYTAPVSTHTKKNVTNLTNGTNSANVKNG